jgi:hypothetical protein
MTVDGRGGFFVRNPLNEKIKRFPDKEAARTAALAVSDLVTAERNAKLMDAGIRIKTTEDIKDLRSRAMHLDNVISPFLIHRNQSAGCAR